MIAPAEGSFETGGVWQHVAAVAGAVAAFAEQRAIRPPVDPIEELTARLRHPVWWTCRHPWRAVRRLR